MTFLLSIIQKRTANPQSLPANKCSSLWSCALEVWFRRFLMRIVDSDIRVYIWGYVFLMVHSSGDLLDPLTATRRTIALSVVFLFFVIAEGV